MNKIRTCNDYPSYCCISCHQDMDMGIEDVPIEVYDRKGNLFAIVCCAKVKQAENEIEQQDNE